jgi:hypothetical protein
MSLIFIVRSAFLSALLCVAAAGAAAAQTPPSPAPAPEATTAPSRGGGLSLPSLSGLAGALGGGSAQPQNYTTFMRNTERQSGLIDIIRKDDEVYFDITSEQLDHPFIIAPVLASGVGQGAFAGRIYSPFIIEFKRVGKRILWVEQNPAFVAPPGTPAANALAISTTDSVINSTPIVAQDEAKTHIVVSAGFFLTDFENVARDLGGSGGGGSPLLILGLSTRAGYSLDGSRSYIEKTKALTKNDEILSSLAFVGSANGPAAAPDGRGVVIRMHYSIIDAPAKSNYIPRFADDRVGYFITAQKHFDDDNADTPFIRYIERWNFNNGPIVYYLSKEIPTQYKPPIRAALLEWNTVFAKAGVPNAIEVRDAPSDVNWDPDDVRYSTVHWITSDRPAFSAYGPSVADPRTGEIIRVSIVIDGENMRAVKRGYVDQVVPTRMAVTAPLQAAVDAASGAEYCDDLSMCDHFAQESAEFAAVGTLALRADGASPATTEKYAENYLQSVVLHEAGHNFGLRHNFAAAIYPLEKLHDKAFTASHGLVNSVMHYTPLNLSPPGKPQGDYFQLRLGPYDEWAIRYGYAKFPGVTKSSDEVAQLKRIADQSTRSDLVYATDEDANGPRAVDPHVATYLLSSDPFAFYQNQFQVVDGLIGRLDTVFPRTDQPYSDERAAFLSMMRQYQRASALATRYIGGLYTSRSHRGQAGGVAPFRPISREDQRRAFATLAEHVFSSKAMRFPPAMLSNLGANNYSHRGLDDGFTRPDFPVETYVANVQDTVMYSLFSPSTMSRISDERLRVANPDATMSLADLFGWMQASVWDDLQPRMTSIDALHRGLQRRYTNYLIAIALAPSSLLELAGFPGDTAPLARYQLRRLDDRLAATLRSRGLDVTTRAHLEDLHDRVSRTLKPTAIRND